MCLRYRHLTDTVYVFSLWSEKEENLKPHLLVRSKFSTAKKKKKKKEWSQKENFNMQQIIMHGKM